MQKRFFQVVQRGEFALVEGCETLGFLSESVENGGYLALFLNWGTLENEILDLLAADMGNSYACLNTENMGCKFRAPDEKDQETIIKILPHAHARCSLD